MRGVGNDWLGGDWMDGVGIDGKGLCEVLVMGMKGWCQVIHHMANILGG